jgi:anti-sigma B factor antagonist
MQSLFRRVIRKPVPTMYESDRRAAQTRSDVALAPEQTDARASAAAGPWAVRLLPANEHHEHVAVLSVQGEIDLMTAPMLREALIPVVKHHTGPVVVDLSEVPFMDSTGVHVLMGTLGRLQPQNRALALVCHEQGQVHRILALAGLLDTVTVYRSLESAMIADDDVLGSEPSRTSGASDVPHAPAGPRTNLAPVTR